MPRTARQKSESGYYHVLIRGIGKQNIFEDDEDRQRFIETLHRYKKEMKLIWFLRKSKGVMHITLTGNTKEQGIYFKIDLKVKQ